MTAVELIARPPGVPRHDALGEGAFWHTEGQALFWVDIVERRGMRLDPATGACRLWTLPSVCSAVIPTRAGGLVAALKDGLYHLDPETGAVAALARPDADPLNRSNDCRTDPSGALWLGSMGDNIDPDGRTVPLRPAAGGLYRVTPDGRSTPVLSGISIPNALAVSPDGRRLTFADTPRNVIWSFALDPDTGALTDRRVLLEGGPGHPDGAAMDGDGCLWNARWGAGRVIRITPDGRIDRELQVPARQPSCCAFGGPDHRTLYITSARQDLEAPTDADGALFAAAVDVAGLPMTPFGG